MSDTTNSGIDSTQKALVTVGVLAACIAIAFVVAKIVDYCYDHHVAANDASSDISEHTRELVRARLAVTAFLGKKKPAENLRTPREVSAKQKKMIRIWAVKAKESRRIAEQRRAQDQAKANRADLIIRVEEAHPATLTIVRETSDKVAASAGPSSANNTESFETPEIPADLKRTLSGLSDSNTIVAETPAVLAASAASGNSSVKANTSSTAAAKDGGKVQPAAKEKTVTSSGDAVDTPRSGAKKPQSAAPNKPSGSKTPEAKPQGSASPRPGKAAAKSSPSPVATTAKGKGPDPYKYKTKPDRGKSASVPVSRSATPAPKADKQAPASPAKPSTDTKKAQAASQPLGSPEPVNSTKTGAQQVSPQTPRERKSPEGEKRDSPGGGAKADSSWEGKRDASPSPTRPTSSLSRRLFTAVGPMEHPTLAVKSPSPSPESKPAAAGASTPGKAKDPASNNSSIPSSGAGFSKPRPKTFQVREDRPGQHHQVPKKLAGSAALYGKASGDLDRHKALVSQKKAAVAPAGQSPSPPPGRKGMVGHSPIVAEAAARKARIKSSKV